MAVKCCSICGAAILRGHPVAVVELSTVEDGRARLERATLCPDCAEWARTFLCPARVDQGPATIEAPVPALATKGA